ncbi:MAG: hypothetical protein LBP22_05020 [Deltaproteobacteria bacterium]|jgi:hypothetical protein|nr:hypothetical protein [Deltaproteobacteria bacterium]
MLRKAIVERSEEVSPFKTVSNLKLDYFRTAGASKDAGMCRCSVQVSADVGIDSCTRDAGCTTHKSETGKGTAVKISGEEMFKFFAGLAFI